MLKFKKDSVFSNYFICNVEYLGRHFTSSEAAYQSSKTFYTYERDKFQYLTPDESKHYARTLKLREDWEDVKLKVMYEVLIAKYTQNEDCKQALLDTKDEELIEDTTGWHDRVYGICYCPKCQGEGQNNLGKLLMKVRKELCQSK